MVCKKCGQQIDDNVAFCVHCGAKVKGNTSATDKKPLYKKWWFWLIVVLVALYIIGSTAEQTPSKETMPNTPAQSATIAVGATEGTNKVPAKETEATVVEDKATLGEKNALRKAKQYLKYSAFSYEGLVHQLEFEGYTNAEAIYGTNNCGANWNEQALKKAKNYLEYSAFSYAGLIHQLEFEQFTTEQATYGADNCGADWNEQAAKSAKNYLKYSAFSKEGLIHQLEFEGFTHEQAVYGVEANGY